MSVNTVVSAAPLYEYFGIKIKFITMLNIVAIKFSFVTVISLYDAFKTFAAGPLINNKHNVQIQIDSGRDAPEYS